MTDENAPRRQFGDTLSGLVDNRDSGVVEWAWLEESSRRVTHCCRLTNPSQGRKFGLLLDRPSHSSGFSHANSKPRDSGFGIPLIMAFIPDMEIRISVVPADATKSTLTKSYAKHTSLLFLVSEDCSKVHFNAERGGDG